MGSIGWMPPSGSGWANVENLARLLDERVLTKTGRDQKLNPISRGFLPPAMAAAWGPGSRPGGEFAAVPAAYKSQEC